MPSTPRGRLAARVGIVAALLALVVSTVFLIGARTADARETGDVDPDSVADVVAPDATSGFGGLRAVASSATERFESATAVLAAAATPPPVPPVFCPAPGAQFVDSWGFARSGGRRHKGVDMMAPYGAPVIAPVDGVVRASHSSLGGIGFYLDDWAGNEFFGSHLASLDVTGPVVAGQQIGTVGSTGNAGSPHLHFEVKPAGSGSVNPFPFTIDWCLNDYTADGSGALLP